MLATAIVSVGTYRGVWIAASIIPLLACALIASTPREVGGPLGGFFAGASNAGPFALGAVAALIAIGPLAMNRRR